jgi:hypothetical protein
VPVGADWHGEPDYWVLRPITDVSAIPESLRPILAGFDCAIPKYRLATREGAVIWGEFERPGQRDVAVLCVHSDHSSSTYVFWDGDPGRAEMMPHSGNDIDTVPRTALNARAVPSFPLEPDMPTTVDHDGLEIRCCECCSMIFYRHNGRWFTLPGAD